jgi:endonuclease-8
MNRSMEGPSLVILREELEPFRGQKVVEVTGNTKQPKDLLKGRQLARVETWGKVLFLTFTSPRKAPIVTKTHFLMFGSYRINEPKPERAPRLKLKFKNGTVYFYSCSIQFDADEYLQSVDRQADIMSDQWKMKHVVKLMKAKKESFLCDLFLDQKVFAGSGNIVKNEVLFNIRCHPLTKLSQVPPADWPKIAQAIHQYGENFYEWKKLFELRRHWQVYRKSSCPVCGTKIVRTRTGKYQRGSFFCPRCQNPKARIKSLKVFPVVPIEAKAVSEKRFDH